VGPGEEGQERRVERQGDSGAVARLSVGGECAAVSERRKAGKRERQDPSSGRVTAATDVRDEPDATCVVLEARVVERIAQPMVLRTAR